MQTQGYTTFHIDVPNDRVDYLELLKTITKNLKTLSKTNTKHKDKQNYSDTDVQKLEKLFSRSNNKICLNIDMAINTIGMSNDIS